jgi:hypothetical protein
MTGKDVPIKVFISWYGELISRIKNIKVKYSPWEMHGCIYEEQCGLGLDGINSVGRDQSEYINGSYVTDVNQYDDAL